MSQNEHKQPTPIDFRRMEDVAETPAEMRELIELYLQTTGDYLTELAGAIAAQNTAEVRRLSHTAAGASATCGIDSIVSLFKQIENNARIGVLNGAEELQIQAVEEFGRVKQALHQYLQQL